MKPVVICFSGFGGQGIVLSAVILGTAAVTKQNYFGVQTQSYGSEARGGECKAELIIARNRINSPVADQRDILVAMFQSALDKYLPTLRSGGTLIIDPHLVKPVDRKDIRVITVPATETAIKVGNRIAANMVMLGYLQAATGLITRENLIDVVKDSVPEKTWGLNIRAVEAGIKLAEGVEIPLEVLP